MRYIISAFIWVIGALFLYGCASVEQESDNLLLSDILNSYDVKTIPFQTNEDGIIFVPVSIEGQPEKFFAIDTGATQSALFQNTKRNTDETERTGQSVRIHGMISSENTPVKNVASLRIGSEVFEDIRIAVLDERLPDNAQGPIMQGLIGLDILANFRMFVDAQNQQISLIQTTAPKLRKPAGWKRVPLKNNPYLDDGRHLKFIEVRIQGRLAPALLDTGSSVNLMNWEIAKDPYLRAFRRRLRKTWQLSGAIGTFNPSVSVKFANFRSGEKFWKERQFIVMDIGSLDILGISGKPFMIAGIDFMGGQSFYIDFADNILFLQNDPADRLRNVTGTRVRMSGAPSDSVAPIVHN